MKTAGVKVNIYRIESTLMELTMSVYKVIFLPVFFIFFTCFFLYIHSWLIALECSQCGKYLLLHLLFSHVTARSYLLCTQFPISSNYDNYRAVLISLLSNGIC